MCEYFLWSTFKQSIKRNAYVASDNENKRMRLRDAEVLSNIRSESPSIIRNKGGDELKLKIVMPEKNKSDSTVHDMHQDQKAFKLFRTQLSLFQELDENGSYAPHIAHMKSEIAKLSTKMLQWRAPVVDETPVMTSPPTTEQLTRTPTTPIVFLQDAEIDDSQDNEMMSLFDYEASNV